MVSRSHSMLRRSGKDTLIHATVRYIRQRSREGAWLATVPPEEETRSHAPEGLEASLRPRRGRRISVSAACPVEFGHHIRNGLPAVRWHQSGALGDGTSERSVSLRKRAEVQEVPRTAPLGSPVVQTSETTP